MGQTMGQVPFRCYCCGEPLGCVFALVTMSGGSDRAFTFSAKHSDRADAATVVRVERVTP